MGICSSMCDKVDKLADNAQLLSNKAKTFTETSIIQIRGAHGELKRRESFDAMRDLGGDAKEIDYLFEKFKAADQSDSGYVTRDEFLRTFRLQENPYAELVFEFFDMDGEHDIGFREFVYGLSGLASAHASASAAGPAALRASPAVARWAFLLFDIDRLGFVTKAELLRDLRNIHNRCRARAVRAGAGEGPPRALVAQLAALQQAVEAGPEHLDLEAFRGHMARHRAAFLPIADMFQVLSLYASSAWSVMQKITERGHRPHFLATLTAQAALHAPTAKVPHLQRKARSSRGQPLGTLPPISLAAPGGWTGARPSKDAPCTSYHLRNHGANYRGNRGVSSYSRHLSAARLPHPGAAAPATHTPPRGEDSIEVIDIAPAGAEGHLPAGPAPAPLNKSSTSRSAPSTPGGGQEARRGGREGEQAEPCRGPGPPSRRPPPVPPSLTTRSARHHTAIPQRQPRAAGKGSAAGRAAAAATAVTAFLRRKQTDRHLQSLTPPQRALDIARALKRQAPPEAAKWSPGAPVRSRPLPSKGSADDFGYVGGRMNLGTVQKSLKDALARAPSNMTVRKALSEKMAPKNVAVIPSLHYQPQAAPRRRL